MNDEKLHQICSEFLTKIVDYWSALRPEEKNGFFRGENLGIFADSSMNSVPVRMSLKILRYDLSLPPHICAVLSGGGVSVQMSAFRLVSGELEWSEENVAVLMDTFRQIGEEWQHEL